MDSDTPPDDEWAAVERAIRALHGQVLDTWGRSATKKTPTKGRRDAR